MSIVEMKVPTIGESVTEVTLSEWLKEDGSYVELDEAICEFESDKATLEFPAEAAGKLIHVASEGDDLEIGSLVAKIDTSESPPERKDDRDSEGETDSNEKKDGTGESTEPDKSQKLQQGSSDSDKSKQSSGEEGSYAKGHPSPAASKILSEKGIDPGLVSGTGKEGRITKEDALKAQKPDEKQADEKKKPSLGSSGFSRDTNREKMSRMRRTIASRLVEAKNQTAMLTTFNEVDLTNIISMRKKYQEKFVEKHGIKLGFMSLFSKACGQVLMEMPEVNAILDDEHLVYHEYADISIAISTPNGLVVPPVHNVESLELHQIEWKIKELAEKARNGKLSLEEMKGGTFTITNGGIFGSMLSTPIINQPQSAILGMHTIKERPVVIDGEIQIRPMMYLALSYDHRVIDGSSSVTFLVKVIELLEDPVRLLMKL